MSEKPTGPRGILTLRGQGLPPLFMPAGSPAAAEGIGGFIVEGATATAAKQGVRLFGQTSRPIRNTANPFDFTVPTESGDQYLDLLEVAPLSYVDGSHDKGPGPYYQGELADRVWSEIQRKTLKYGPPLAALHLLIFRPIGGSTSATARCSSLPCSWPSGDIRSRPLCTTPLTTPDGVT